MGEAELVFNILDELQVGKVMQQHINDLFASTSTSSDALDYFHALNGDPRLAGACQQAIAIQLDALKIQHDQLQAELTDGHASLEEAQMLLTEMQRIPTIVSRDMLKQMVLLVLLQHRAKETV
jgi:hypothetical protein